MKFTIQFDDLHCTKTVTLEYPELDALLKAFTGYLVKRREA